MTSPEGEKALESGDLSSLKYLDAFLMESLRLFPPGAYVLRECPADTLVGGHLIPKGTEVHVIP